VDGSPTEPRQAATVIVLRGGAERLEVLLVRRNPQARFMGGAWVFPGGATHAGEDADHAATAVRELEEEAGIALPEDARLHPWSRWITPEVAPIRFDTRFYVALAPPHSPPRPDGEETVDAGWFAPRRALDAHSAGEMELVFPTIKHLESLLPYATSQEVLDAVGDRVEPVLPKVIGEGEEQRIVLPGDPDYGSAQAI
jgi:8-oxo-dGTP pyrophosphatase MutT (NUDIX family)